MADLTDEQLEFLADMELNDPTIGQLRQAGLTVEQMRTLYFEVRILIGELNDNDKLSDCNELLGWLDDAIAAKEWEARTPTYINADGTLTLSAMSDGNSTYVFLYEPAKASEEHTHSFEWVIDKEATETEDGLKHEECACGAKQNENTVIPKTGTGNLVPEPEVPNGLSTGAIVAIVIACVVLLAGGGFAVYLLVFKKKQDTGRHPRMPPCVCSAGIPTRENEEFTKFACILQGLGLY